MHRQSKKVIVPKFVFPLPFPLTLLYKGMAFHDFVLISGKILNDIKSASPKPENVGILLHELEHVKRIRKAGRLQFGWQFTTNKKYRFEEELAANVAELTYIKHAGGTYDIDKRARHLSGILYRWCTDHATAKARLEKIWREA